MKLDKVLRKGCILSEFPYDFSIVYKKEYTIYKNLIAIGLCMIGLHTFKKQKEFF